MYDRIKLVGTSAINLQKKREKKRKMKKRENERKKKNREKK